MNSKSKFKKVAKGYRIEPSINQKMEAQVQHLDVTETSYVETAIDFLNKTLEVNNITKVEEIKPLLAKKVEE